MSRVIGAPIGRATDPGEVPRSLAVVDIVPLTRAVICIDCEAITQGIHECPACGSLSLLSVARILNRTAAYDASAAGEVRERRTA
jgi:hypothetical protein